MNTPAKQSKPPVKSLTKDMNRFYSVLGQFNTNMVAMALQDPANIKEITDHLIINCTTHANECGLLGSAFMWDWDAHACVRKPDGGIDPVEGGGEG